MVSLVVDRIGSAYARMMGPCDYEVAFVEHLRENPMIRVGLDVFEDEPYIKPGLSDMKNIVVVPHMAFASKGKIKGYPI
ncbi:Glycerate dehydrogenase [Capsicum chinense]|nr:Glycerate dehydrogenase [Capsicum chinense]